MTDHETRENTTAPTSEDAQPHYASFARRISGYLIDFTLTLPAQAWLALSALSSIKPAFEDLAANPNSEQALQNYIDTALGTIPGLMLGSTLVLLVFTLYYIVTLSLWGRTLGGQILGTRCTATDGSKASLQQIALRQGAFLGISLAGSVIPGGGIATLANPLWMIWDPRKQMLIDKAGKTIVIRVTPPTTAH